MARFFGLAALGASLWALMTRRANASIPPVVTRDDSPAFPIQLPTDLPPLVTMPPPAPIIEAPTIITDAPNVVDPLPAFLYAIRRAEHNAVDVANGIDYRTFYGGRRFSNLSDHPAATGEIKPVQLSREMCIRAGFSSGVCYSTAAGGYQATLPTWNEFRAAGSWGPRLPDFSQASQDEFARRVLLKTGALAALQSGDLRRAVYLASSRWASLPGSTAGQPTRSYDFVVAAFNDGLGNLG